VNGFELNLDNKFFGIEILSTPPLLTSHPLYNTPVVQGSRNINYTWALVPGNTVYNYRRVGFLIFDPNSSLLLHLLIGDKISLNCDIDSLTSC